MQDLNMYAGIKAIPGKGNNLNNILVKKKKRKKGKYVWNRKNEQSVTST